MAGIASLQLHPWVGRWGAELKNLGDGVRVAESNYSKRVLEVVGNGGWWE